MSAKMENIKACCFDAYGTLFDVNSSARECAQEIGENWQDFSSIWRQKQLEYTWLRTLMGKFRDFWHVTGDALDYAMQTFQIEDPYLRSKLMELYLKLKTYDEVESSLKAIKERGLKLAVLSNGSSTMLTSALRHSKIEPYFDYVFSVDEVQKFKTHPDTYKMATDRLGLAPNEISFQTSNAWDVAGAAAFGFQVAWINRFSQVSEKLNQKPICELENLSQLNDVLVD